MVLLNVGINRIRDRVQSDLFKVQAGTGTTAATVDDTDLETAVADTKNDPDVVSSDQQLSITNIVLSTQGNGSSLSEAKATFGSTTNEITAFRVLFAPLSKTSAEEHSHITRMFFRNNK